MIKILLLLLVSSFFIGCATSNNIYYWGEYEDVIYKSYTSPGEMPPERQIEIMEADYQKAAAKNKPLPPGWNIHLGTLYYQVGKRDLAKKKFLIEKKNFPESAVLIDNFLKKWSLK